MKKPIISLLLITSFCIMLVTSELTKSSALTGLNLWLFTLVPTLLPFMIVSSVIMETNSHKIITFFLSPVMKHLFRLNEAAGYPFFMGLLCGFPMGSKITADMVSKGELSVLQGNILITFCNNISPAFIMGYMIPVVLKLSGPLSLGITCIMFLSPVLSGIILSRLILRLSAHISGNASIHNNGRHDASPSSRPYSLIDTCILKSFENIIKLGGYIIIFTIICGIITPLINNDFILCTLSGFLEITSGLNWFFSMSCDKTVLLTVCVLTSFGGLCSIAQTYSMINRSGLSIKIYILGKFFNSLVTLIMIILYYELFM